MSFLVEVVVATTCRSQENRMLPENILETDSLEEYLEQQFAVFRVKEAEVSWLEIQVAYSVQVSAAAKFDGEDFLLLAKS